MKHIFLDTEFTDLVSNAKLISIALVAEDGAEFYAELAGTYRMHEASMFCSMNVLPLLQGGEYSMDWTETRVRLAEWLTEQCSAAGGGSDGVTIVTDTVDWDWKWIKALLGEPENWPNGLSREPKLLPLTLEAREVFDREIATRRHHHARDDAHCLMLAWRATRFTEAHELRFFLENTARPSLQHIKTMLDEQAPIDHVKTEVSALLMRIQRTL